MSSRRAHERGLPTSRPIPLRSLATRSHTISDYSKATEIVLDTQYKSEVGLKHEFWGALEPCRPSLARMDFLDSRREYTIGHDPENGIVFSDRQLNQALCKIRWDDFMNVVTIVNPSLSKSTVERNAFPVDFYALLRDRDEVELGTLDDDDAGTYRIFFDSLPRVCWRASCRTSTIYVTESLAARALRRATGTWYAVKIIHRTRPNVQSAARNAAIFQREISILQQLNHPNICCFKEAFMEEQAINTLQTLYWNTCPVVICADTLENKADSVCLYYYFHNVTHELPVEGEAKTLTRQTCSALKHMHTQNIIHRDLKPENIPLTAEAPPTVKVVDFGLSKAIDSLTGLHVFLGRYEKGLESALDSWSMGVVAYYILAGHTPFQKSQDLGACASESATRHARGVTCIVNWTPLIKYGSNKDAGLSGHSSWNGCDGMQTQNAAQQPRTGSKGSQDSLVTQISVSPSHIKSHQAREISRLPLDAAVPTASDKMALALTRARRGPLRMDHVSAVIDKRHWITTLVQRGTEKSRGQSSWPADGKIKPSQRIHGASGS
ncbi:kinase-like protein [Obba rivulosa]|uniref:Kinase-like protein n=1 Tax=Obba rivulosa TaxID=1052685 RepID=A0A8E2B2R0_9APHY|nr:kinase-like protein [Obba rivulosa]